jgi:hypothetical protein
VPKSSFHHLDYIDLEQIDPIYNMPFEQMIKKAFMADKNFLIAKTKSLVVKQFEEMKEQDSAIEEEQLLKECVDLHNEKGKPILNFFNLYGIMPKLFQKKGNQYISRYTEKTNVSCMNPVSEENASMVSIFRLVV